MKHISLTLTALALGAFCFTALSAPAKDTSSPKPTARKKATAAKKKTTPKKATAQPTPVATALSKLPLTNGPIAPNAKYYVYLQSAAWSAPCIVNIPQIVKAYDELKANGIEIVYINHESPEAVEKYLTRFKAPFPGVHCTKENASALPGYTEAYYFPYAIMLDAQGNVIKDGFATFILEWKEAIAEHESKQN